MNRTLASLARLCAFAALLGAIAPAQEGERDPRQDPTKRFGPDRTAAPGVFDLSFAGGTLEQFAAALRKASGETVSIILAEQVRGYRVPSLELHSSLVEPALAAVALIVRPR